MSTKPQEVISDLTDRITDRQRAIARKKRTCPFADCRYVFPSSSTEESVARHFEELGHHTSDDAGNDLINQTFLQIKDRQGRPQATPPTPPTADEPHAANNADVNPRPPLRSAPDAARAESPSASEKNKRKDGEHRSSIQKRSRARHPQHTSVSYVRPRFSGRQYRGYD
ncbi:hypothetical protein LY76DRAFT_26121 [Colletotrichum caudatum]|nr:hypothetical protein LY76DRAFT_26121 [Colletotrichum caudatum]